MLDSVSERIGITEIKPLCQIDHIKETNILFLCFLVMIIVMIIVMIVNDDDQ